MQLPSGGARFALIAAVSLACFAGLDQDRQLDRIIMSPDSTREAIAYINMGGGAAGWCYTRVAVRTRSSATINLKALDDSLGYVFQASCQSSPQLAWDSSTALHIRYQLGQYGVSAYMRPTSDDGKVRITYEVLNQ